MNWNNFDYARFSHIGTWSRVTEYCETCEFSDQHLIEPLTIEWGPGSDELGDFSWCGYSIMVTENVNLFLIQKGFQCEFGKVEVKEPSAKNKKKIISFPYEDPILFGLRPAQSINLNIDKSKLEIDGDCPVCKRLQYKFKMDGLVIPKSEIKDMKIFRIEQFGLSSLLM